MRYILRALTLSSVDLWLARIITQLLAASATNFPKVSVYNGTSSGTSWDDRVTNIARQG